MRSPMRLDARHCSCSYFTAWPSIFALQSLRSNICPSVLALPPLRYTNSYMDRLLWLCCHQPHLGTFSHPSHRRATHTLPIGIFIYHFSMLFYSPLCQCFRRHHQQGYVLSFSCLRQAAHREILVFTAVTDETSFTTATTNHLSASSCALWLGKTGQRLGITASFQA